MWGQDWGTMIWGGVLPIPMLGPVAWLLLGALMGTVLAGWRGWLSRAGTMVALLAIAVLPVVAVAAQIAVPNAFLDGTPAEAAEVNANFDALVAESNDQDTRIADVEARPTISCNWVGTRQVNGDGPFGGCQDDLRLTCSGGLVTSITLVCP